MVCLPHQGRQSESHHAGVPRRQKSNLFTNRSTGNIADLCRRNTSEPPEICCGLDVRCGSTVRIVIRRERLPELRRLKASELWSFEASRADSVVCDAG